MPRRAGVPVIVWAITLVAATLAGCGSSAPTATLTAAPVTIFGRIISLTTDQVTIQDAEFLEGDAAEAAASADGMELVNNFYLRDHTTTRTLRLDPACTVQVTGWDASGDVSPMPYDVPRLVEAFADPAVARQMFYSSDYFWRPCRAAR
jgi:hypothetical protein